MTIVYTMGFLSSAFTLIYFRFVASAELSNAATRLPPNSNTLQSQVRKLSSTPAHVRWF